MNVFVYRPGAIGDTILTLPALEALRSRFPGCAITYAGNASMLPLLPVEQRLTADDRRLLPLFQQRPQPWPGADIHIIFARQPTGLPGLQREPLEAIAHGKHVADWLAEAIDPAFAARAPKLDVPSAKGAPLVLHPGAGSRSKRWPLERFEDLARGLAHPLAVVRGPADEDVEIHAEHVRWDNLPLTELARRLAGSGLFVGNDSGISHLAAAVGVPTLAIYVSTAPATWGIRGPRTRILVGDVSIETALAACRELLDSPPDVRTTLA